MIIGVCGWIGTGKDTVADYLVNSHQYRRDSFAHGLKDIVAVTFGWDRELLEGRTREAREWREQVDTWWANRVNIPHLTPRWVLQYWGTEVIRKNFHNDFWIAALESRLRNSQDNIVISDCRFPNEIKSIKDQGGKVVWVQRGPLPEWYQAALNYNAGKKKIGWALGKGELERAGIHPSEYAWVGTEFDAILDNNGSMDRLFEQVRNLVLEDQSSSQPENGIVLADNLNIQSLDYAS